MVGSPEKRRSMPAENNGGSAAVSKIQEEGVTTEPAAAYISSRTSLPHPVIPEHLPHFETYKEQRLYNYVMSTSSSPLPSSGAASRMSHSRGSSISSISENGNFFTNLFTPANSSPTAAAHSRSQSLGGPPAAATNASRKFSHFFGLGSGNDNASNSGLAFSSNASSKRSVSNSTTLSNLVLPESHNLVGHNPNLMIRDEFADVNFAELLGGGVPKSPLQCTPQGFHALHDKSMEVIDRLYAGYMERTRALADALAEIAALRDDMEQKEQKIEGLRFSVDQLANVQETLSKASEEAEKTAEKANAEAKVLKAENSRLKWEAKMVRDVEMDDASSIVSLSPQKYGVGAKEVEALKISRSRTKSSNSDSGFESESDSASVFSHDGKMSSVLSSPAPTYPASIMTVEEDKYELESNSGYNAGSGPLAQLRNVLRRTAAVADSHSTRCDCGVVIGRLKNENGQLIGRVKELEGCLDNCLDLVGGI
ncbi:hypothetical protein H072_1950 [Dactylellina haptotyla CBS 200.50]|uniref:Uncharacterized protein n=1 Tax=Dactylellina haptotyla (strain CBS 200.50) TaxID=1284197 RepID=S8ASW2_DACHA|nr:hypothetical protein H072_1950 [Dactylellina haptotyla CBS 200.50]